MKTNHLWMTLAALAIAGCSQNEITDINPDTNAPIGFGVYTGVQTKGLVTDNSTTPVYGLKAPGKGFGIMAYLTQGKTYVTADAMLHMNNQHVTWNSAKWEYSPEKYWPNNNTDYLTFFAYAPYTSTPTATTDYITITPATSLAAPTLGFTVADKQKEQVDLVVAESQKNQQYSSNSGAVKFDFKHVLCKVDMKAKATPDLSSNAQTKVYITKIELTHTNQIVKTATLSLDYAHASTNWTPDTYYASRYEITDGSSTATGVLNLATANWHGYTEKSIDISSGTVPLFVAGQFLFLVPHKTTNATDVKAKIYYDIVTLPDGEPSSTGVKSSHSNEVNLGTDIFDKGKAYCFTFNINLRAITIDVNTDVSPWGSVTDVPVEVANN